MSARSVSCIYSSKSSRPRQALGRSNTTAPKTKQVYKISGSAPLKKVEPGPTLLPPSLLSSLQPESKSSVRKPMVCKPVDRMTSDEGKEEKILTDPSLLRTFRAMYSDRMYRVRIGTVLNLTYDGSGLVNSVITNATLCLTADFVSYATVFNEFFVKSFHCRFQPFSEYGYPVGFVNTSGVATTQQWNIPLALVSLQHATPAYTTITSMAGNPSTRLSSTGVPWEHVWVNNEDYRSGVSEGDVLTAFPTQGWCNTAATPASAYTGQVQLFSPTTSGGVHSAGIGVVLVNAEFLFRVRY